MNLASITSDPFNVQPITYATWDQTNPNIPAYIGLTLGNTKATLSGTPYVTVYATVAKTDKRYCEITINSQAHAMYLGLNTLTAIPANGTEIGWDTNGFSYWQTGYKETGGVSGAYGATYTVGDIISVVFSGSALNFWKNGTDQGQAFSGIVATLSPAITLRGTDAITINCGASAWAYTPPVGYVGWYT